MRGPQHVLAHEGYTALVRNADVNRFAGLAVQDANRNFGACAMHVTTEALESEP